MFVPKIALNQKKTMKRNWISAPVAMETMTYFDVNFIENQAEHHYQQQQAKYNVM